MERLCTLILRAPVVRHIRAIISAYRVEKHYRMWSSIGALPVHRDRDEKVILAIWRGER